MQKQNYVILGIILIIVFVFVFAGAVFVREKRQTNIEPAPITQPPVIEPSPPQQEPKQDYTTRTHPRSERKIIEGWQAYENEGFGFEVQYPKDWFAYDLEKFNEDNKNSACYPFGPWGIEGTVIFNEQDLGKCVILGPGYDNTEDFIIKFYKGEEIGFPENYLPNEPQREIIFIDGIKAVKVPTVENTSALPRGNIISIGFNYKGNSYDVFLKQADSNGHYNSILDQILSTFRFLK